MKYFTIIALLLVALNYSTASESDEKQLVQSETQDELKVQELAQAFQELSDSLDEDAASELTEADLLYELPEEMERKRMTLKGFLRALRKLLKSRGMGRSVEEEARGFSFKKFLQKIRKQIIKNIRRAGRSEEEGRGFNFRKFLQKIRKQIIKNIRRAGRSEEEGRRFNFRKFLQKIRKQIIKNIRRAGRSEEEARGFKDIMGSIAQNIRKQIPHEKQQILMKPIQNPWKEQEFLFQKFTQKRN